MLRSNKCLQNRTVNFPVNDPLPSFETTSFAGGLQNARGPSDPSQVLDIA